MTTALSHRDRVDLELRVGQAVRSLAANPTPEGKAVLATLRERLVADDDRRRERRQQVLVALAQLQP